MSYGVDDLFGAGQVDFKRKTLNFFRGNQGHHDVITT